MVDRAARRRLAELLRHVATGRISKDEFCCAAEELLIDSADSGLAAVYEAAASLHEDLSLFCNVRFQGRYRLSSTERRRLAIAILFLHSDVEYGWPVTEWPPFAAVADCLLAYACGTLGLGGVLLLTAAGLLPWLAVVALACLWGAFQLYRWSQRLAKRFQRQWEEEQMRHGDYDAWPFLRRGQLAEARRHPPYFCGRS
jgi:hypothetical protein